MLLAPHPHPFLPVPSPVGAQQPESFIGYFTTACAAILLAILSYILLPRTVRLRLLAGEEPGEPQPRSTPALAPASLHLLGHLPVALPTSDTLGLRGSELLGEHKSIRHKKKKNFAHLGRSAVTPGPRCQFPDRLLSSCLTELCGCVSAGFLQVLLHEGQDGVPRVQRGAGDQERPD